jgi:hypothetical protein
MIEDHDSFQTTNDLQPLQQQIPISSQLAITLYWLGHFGNAASVESIAQWARCSAGTVVASMHQVFGTVTLLHDYCTQGKGADIQEFDNLWILVWCVSDPKHSQILDII